MCLPCVFDPLTLRRVRRSTFAGSLACKVNLLACFYFRLLLALIVGSVYPCLRLEAWLSCSLFGLAFRKVRVFPYHLAVCIVSFILPTVSRPSSRFLAEEEGGEGYVS